METKRFIKEPPSATKAHTAAHRQYSGLHTRATTLIRNRRKRPVTKCGQETTRKTHLGHDKLRRPKMDTEVPALNKKGSWHWGTSYNTFINWGHH